MIDPNRYTSRTFDLQNYNCAHFVREVWLDHCGVDLGDYVPRPLTYASARAAFAKHESLFLRDKLVELREPEDPCLVLITHRLEMPHCGILVAGKLLHLSKSGEVRYEPLEPKPNSRVRYFR